MRFVVVIVVVVVNSLDVIAIDVVVDENFLAVVRTVVVIALDDSLS